MEHAPAWLTNSLIYLGAAVIAVPLSREPSVAAKVKLSLPLKSGLGV